MAALKMKARTELGISTAGLPAQLAAGAAGLNAGVSSLLNGIGNTGQKSATLGVRWDFMKNTAARVQYDRIALDSNSNGQLVNLSPSFKPGGNVNLVSAGLDFVF